MTPYDRLREAMLQKACELRVPVTGGIEVTARCNLNCVHCYINLPVGDKEAASKELNTSQWIDLIDQLVDSGCLWLFFTGGEVFLRPDFLKLYSHAHRKGLLPTVFTNGTTITHRIGDFLREVKPVKVEISLYGATRRTHDSVTRVRGSFEKAIRGIELLLTRGIPLFLKTAVTSLNLHELEGIKALAASLEVDFRFDPLLNRRIDGGGQPERFRIAPEEVVALGFPDTTMFEGLERLDSSRSAAITDSGRPNRCGAGAASFHIDPYGMLYPCLMWRVSGYGLRDGSFREGWQDFMPQTGVAKRSKPVKCDSCHLISLCPQCPGWGQTEHNDAMESVDFLCRVTHHTAERLGLNDPAREGADEETYGTKADQTTI